MNFFWLSNICLNFDRFSLRKLIHLSGTSVFLSVGFMTSAFAASRAPDYSIHQEYTSTRALGMGNAFTAIADDHSTIFYNPAGLAVRKDGHLRMFLRAGLDGDALDLNKDIKDAGDNEVAMAEALEKHYGEHVYFRAPTIGMLLAKPKWSLAIIPVDFSVDAALHRSLGPSVFVNAYLDTTIAFGRGKIVRLPFSKKKKLAVGWSLKTIHRAHYSDVVQSAQLANDEDLVSIDRASEGLTLDADIGALYSLTQNENAKVQSNLALVVRNVFDYGFPVNFGLLNKDANEPPDLIRRVDLGSSVSVKRLWIFEPKFSVDIRDMGHPNWTFKKGFHAGTEMAWKIFNWWKGHWSAGINQGYWTAGFGARMAIFQLDLATWGEEVGTSGAPHESRRYILEAALDF